MKLTGVVVFALLFIAAVIIGHFIGDGSDAPTEPPTKPPDDSDSCIDFDF